MFNLDKFNEKHTDYWSKMTVKEENWTQVNAQVYIIQNTILPTENDCFSLRKFVFGL